MVRNSLVSLSICSILLVGSTYEYQGFPDTDRGISYLDHLQARWIHTQATIVGGYLRHMVVRCRELVAIKYEVWANSFEAFTNWQHFTTWV